MNLADEVRQVVLEILVIDTNLHMPDENIPLKQYGMDSVAMIRLAVAVEKRFGVKFKGRDLLERNFTSIGEIMKLVLNKQQGAIRVPE
ncbi:acyl carrier protein [Paenibacillus sp. UMB4589-SE434]|uniref:acyl carrier protein n=1 Tax=Paenibacillus sp. UMB4589-SE434 TaxID=3046314 RepID=UPI00254F92CA|nr:acyl carrier protein [Paenibacillus sp. UMB4589-SE434]MDK8181869.1 acyl carrier protein [Paenibacillus sp. UMB4589-SE434]